MNKYAIIENNTVVNVVVSEEEAEVILAEMFPSPYLIVKETEATKTAGVNGTWDGNVFRPASPYASWVWHEETFTWLPPVAFPTEDRPFKWDETTTNWVAVEG